MIAALFVQKDGVYFGLPNVDPYDEERDARKYSGPHRVIAHPPCSAWSHMAPVNKARYGHEIGDDDGCFESALASVRKWGGVLEHPASSLAWPAFKLPRPRGSGWIRDMFDRGWVCQFSQCAYGHKARKMTWLYFVGEHPPVLNWRRPKPSAWISTDRPRAELAKLGIAQLSSREASRTPIELRNALIEMVECVP